MEILIYSGIPGSGKTLDATYEALKHFKKENSRLKYFIYYTFSKLGLKTAKDKINYYKSFPYGKINNIYSSYPILLDKKNNIYSNKYSIFDFNNKWSFYPNALFIDDEIQLKIDSDEYKELLTTGNIDLCDTVTVRFSKLGVDVQSNVIDITWDVLADRYDQIQIGDKRASLADTIEDQLETINTLATADDVARTVDRATGVLNAGRRGHVVINRNAEGFANEILFLDNENLAAAVNVLRINMNGIGFSSSGYQGPYYQAWTLDGVLSLGGVNNAYGDLQILDPSGRKICSVDKDGFKLYDTNGSTLIGSWSHTGINVKKGSISGVSIDIARGNNIGLYCNGSHFQFGDFEVNDAYGRQILESSDEMTGMSGDPGDPDGLFLWAGYTDGGDYAFAVNEAGAYCKYGSIHYNIGQQIYELWQAVGGGGGGCATDSCSSDGGSWGWGGT